MVLKGGWVTLLQHSAIVGGCLLNAYIGNGTTTGLKGMNVKLQFIVLNASDVLYFYVERNTIKLNQLVHKPDLLPPLSHSEPLWVTTEIQQQREENDTTYGKS